MQLGSNFGRALEQSQTAADSHLRHRKLCISVALFSQRDYRQLFSNDRGTWLDNFGGFLPSTLQIPDDQQRKPVVLSSGSDH